MLILLILFTSLAIIVLYDNTKTVLLEIENERNLSSMSPGDDLSELSVHLFIIIM